MKKDATLIIRINSDIKNRVQEIASKYNVSVSEIINASLMDIARRGDINLIMKGRLGLLLPKDRDSDINIIKIKKAITEAIDESGLNNEINKVYLYGSFARNEETKDSDIDLRFETSNNISMFDIGNIRYLIKEKTGRDVDISNEDVDKLDPLFYENVKKDEICIYERQRLPISSSHQGAS